MPTAPMLWYYWSLFSRLPKVIFRTTDRMIAAGAVILFFLAFFNPELKKSLDADLQQYWPVLSRWWSIVPVTALVMYELARANYERISQAEMQRDLAQARIAPTLELIHLPDEAPYVMEAVTEAGDPIRYLRLGVHNKSLTETIGQISLEVTALDPSHGLQMPYPLRRMHGRANALHPDQTTHFDLIGKVWGQGHVTDRMEFCFAKPGPEYLPALEYRGQLTAYGANARSQPINFLIRMSGDRLGRPILELGAQRAETQPQGV